MKDIYIERFLKIDDSSESEKIWQFYVKAFQDTNENTPIAQIFPKDFFLDFLSNERVVKLIVKDNADEICGVGLVTDQVNLEWNLSPDYFKKHYAGAKIYQCPVIAVAKNKRGLQVASILVRKMIDELPDNGFGVFLYSRMHNGFLPKIVESIMKNYIGSNAGGHEVDAEVCCIVTKDIVKNPIKITI